jgi:hypothetical protein
MGEMLVPVDRVGVAEAGCEDPPVALPGGCRRPTLGGDLGETRGHTEPEDRRGPGGDHAQPSPGLEAGEGDAGNDRGEDQAGGAAQPQGPPDLRHPCLEQAAPAQFLPERRQHRPRPAQHPAEPAAGDPSVAVGGRDQGRPQRALPGGADGGVDSAETVAQLVE